MHYLEACIQLNLSALLIDDARVIELSLDLYPSFHRTPCFMHLFLKTPGSTGKRFGLNLESSRRVKPPSLTFRRLQVESQNRQDNFPSQRIIFILPACQLLHRPFKDPADFVGNNLMI